MEDGSHRPISQVRVGDRVLVFRDPEIVASPVLAILTHLHAPIIDFLDLYTSDTTLRLTPLHFLLVRKQNQMKITYVRAEDVSVGDFVYRSSSASNLTFIRINRIEKRTVQKENAYTPLTLEGTVVVNDLVASCYATYSPSVMHILTKPVQWWFWLLIQFEFYRLAEWSSLVVVSFLDLYNEILLQGQFFFLCLI